MYIHNIVIFNGVKSGNSVIYKATNLKHCFFSKISKITDTPNGVSLASVGTCLIPAFSLPSSAFVPPSEWQAAQLEEILARRLVTLREEDIIAKGHCDKDIMSAKDIFAVYDAFTIQSIMVDDFSSNQGYLLKGV